MQFDARMVCAFVFDYIHNAHIVEPHYCGPLNCSHLTITAKSSGTDRLTHLLY